VPRAGSHPQATFGCGVGAELINQLYWTIVAALVASIGLFRTGVRAAQFQLHRHARVGHLQQRLNVPQNATCVMGGPGLSRTETPKLRANCLGTCVSI
jgi:hypothetical protein